MSQPWHRAAAKPVGGQVRPYGLYFHEGVVFQVYSPDELRQAQVQAKIEEDLAGAVTHWRDRLKKWVFVYNARRGLAPDIPAMLQVQQARHPDVEIEALSSHALWVVERDHVGRGLSMTYLIHELEMAARLRAGVFPVC